MSPLDLSLSAPKVAASVSLRACAAPLDRLFVYSNPLVVSRYRGFLHPVGCMIDWVSPCPRPESSQQLLGSLQALALDYTIAAAHAAVSAALPVSVFVLLSGSPGTGRQRTLWHPQVAAPSLA